MKPTCYICGELLIAVPSGFNGRLQPRHATKDHVPPNGIFNDPKPSNLITVPCCYQCNKKHSGFDEQLRAFAAIEIGKNSGGEKILFEKVIGSTMKKRRQKSFFTQIANSFRDKVVMTEEGPELVTVASVQTTLIFEGIINITKGLLFKLHPKIDYHRHTFGVLDIHNATLDKGLRDEQMKIICEIASKTNEEVRGNFQEFRFWRGFEPDQRRGIWLLVFYESLAFVVFHEKNEPSTLLNNN